MPSGYCAGYSPLPGPMGCSHPASTPPRASTPQSPTRRPSAAARAAVSPGRSASQSAPGSPRTCTPSTNWRFGYSGSWACASPEAFGVLVDDIVDLGDTGMLAVQGQGGRTFHVRDDRGAVVAVPYKPTLKTAAGCRVLVVPPRGSWNWSAWRSTPSTPTPTTGEVDPTARLVPGVKTADRSGQAAYRHAFEEATIAEGLSSADLGFAVSSHLLRKSCATDLAWAAGIEDAVRRRFMGHRAGDDVFGRIYTLDHPEVAPLARVAEILDNNIAATIGTLVTPTVKRVTWGTGNPIAARTDYVDATLGAAGWLVDPGSADDPLCDAERVSAELDIYRTTARRWLRDGTLPSVVVPDAVGMPRRFALLSHVWAHQDRMVNRVMLPDLAQQLGVSYHELYNTVRRLGLEVEQHPTSREYQLSLDVAEALRAEQCRVRALRERSMKVAAAACQLAVAFSTAAVMSRKGNLEVDPETDASGALFVTRESVARLALDRRCETGAGRK